MIRLSTLVTVTVMLHWYWWGRRWYDIHKWYMKYIIYYDIMVPFPLIWFGTETIMSNLSTRVNLIRFSQRATWERTRRSWTSWRGTTDPQYPPQLRKNMRGRRGSTNIWNALPRIERWSFRYTWKLFNLLSGSQWGFCWSNQDRL